MAPGTIDISVARDALRACRLFAAVDERSLDVCVAALRERRFKRGEVIFHLGDPGDSLFVIATGTVKILVPDEEGGDAAILTTLGPGGFFGALALLDGAPRSASAVALDPTIALVLHRDAFQAVLDAEPDLRRALFAALAAEIRRLTVQIEDLHFLDLPGRLASHLLRRIEADDAVRGPDGEVGLEWPFTQAELAGMIGGSRQSVNRLLADFVDDGILRFDGDTLVITDPLRLAGAARR
jgi:CRP-like cAMP-binding protein